MSSFPTVWLPPEGKEAAGFTSTGRKGRAAGSDGHTFPLGGREPCLGDLISYKMVLLQNFASQAPQVIDDA